MHSCTLLRPHENKTKVRVISSATAEVFSAGIVSGVAVNIGGKGTSVAVVINGKQINHNFTEKGGNKLSKIIVSEKQNDLPFRESSFEDLIKIKQNCICKVNTRECSFDIHPIDITLPNYNISLSSEERCNFTEYLWENDNSIQNTIAKTINECDFSDKNLLWANIVISGYTSKLPFLPDRLEHELYKSAPPKTVVKVIALPDREHAGCIGEIQLLYNL